jgi:prolyl-tRNA editing enzyme YbaK/EbsC (Cys-tRNA(Pro) deacylase)
LSWLARRRESDLPGLRQRAGGHGRCLTALPVGRVAAPFFLGDIPEIMTVESVRAFLALHAPDIDIVELESSTATVEMAAQGHGVEPAQIAKTLSLRIKDRTLLIVTSGTARLNNRKIKDVLGGKPRMLSADEVVAATGHPVGGVCPFGLTTALPVYCDVSLRAFDEVVPAAGSINSALRISPARLAQLVNAEWVDVC